MYRIVIFVLVCLTLTNTEDLEDLSLPWHWRLTRQSGSEGPNAEGVCKLPPYPAHGRYLVKDELGAKPGDVFQNVSLVQYEVDDSQNFFKILALSCSSGKWSENAFKYQGEKLYFDSSWCPMFCPFSEVGNATESTSEESMKNCKDGRGNTQMCKTQPHRERGGSYYHICLPSVTPGITSVTVYHLFRFTTDDNGLYNVQSLACHKGLWLVKLFHRRYILSFKKRSLCAIFCASSATQKQPVNETSTSTPRPPAVPKELNNPYLPLRSTLANSSNPRDPEKKLCELPPYLQRSKYLVVDASDAKPGDVFQNVSLVQYTENEKNDAVLIKFLSCSSGKWSQSIFQYKSEIIYFNSSWCPLMCSSFEINNGTEFASVNVSETNTTKGDNETEELLCEIPPHPEHGRYYLRNNPAAGPGYVSKQFITLYRYVLDVSNGLFEIKQFSCNAGTWFKSLFEAETDKSYFNKKDWCPMLCSASAAEELSASRPVKPAVVLNISHLPWSTVLTEGAGNTKEQARPELCELPPYPENGSYVVVDQPEARPGQVLESVSLVQYVSVNDSHIEIQALNCSFGQWSKSIFQSLTNSVYFDTTWCPYLCLPSDANATSDMTDVTKSENTEVIKDCELPPYPVGGSYYVHGNPGARPGDTFEEFVISQYVLDDDRKFYQIEELSCRWGVWTKTLFRMDGDRLYFNKIMWCPLLCPIFRNSST